MTTWPGTSYENVIPLSVGGVDIRGGFTIAQGKTKCLRFDRMEIGNEMTSHVCHDDEILLPSEHVLRRLP